MTDANRSSLASLGQKFVLMRHKGDLTGPSLLANERGPCEKVEGQITSVHSVDKPKKVSLQQLLNGEVKTTSLINEPVTEEPVRESARLRLNGASGASFELELRTDQLIAQVGAVQQRQVRQLISERAPHFGALVGILDVADVTNRLAAKRHTFNGKIMPHQMVDDSATSTGVIHKNNIGLMLQTEVEDHLLNPDGIETVQLDWL